MRKPWFRAVLLACAIGGSAQAQTSDAPPANAEQLVAQWLASDTETGLTLLRIKPGAARPITLVNGSRSPWYRAVLVVKSATAVASREHTMMTAATAPNPPVAA